MYPPDRLSIHRTILTVILIYFHVRTADSQKDLVQPNETHLEGVPYFIQHPKPLYYTMKGRPAVVECVAEPVSHAIVECAEQAIAYKGPNDSGRLKVTRLDSNNRPDVNGKRWKLELQVRAREVEEWFDSYVCRCEAWNKVVELQRPKKVVSNEAAIVEAYLDRKFQLEPVSTELIVGNRLVLTCIPPKGKPDPEVYWLKDGKRVTKEAFPHILLNDYNHLIVENVSSTDAGNYTCVAECLGVEYRYATANVAIHLAGFPSAADVTAGVESEFDHQWADWTPCAWVTGSGSATSVTSQPLCQQQRHRLCGFQANVAAASKKQAAFLPTSQSGLPLAGCPEPQVQIRNCSVTQCNGSRTPFLLTELASDVAANRTITAKTDHVPEIVIFLTIFLMVLCVFGVVAFLAIRRKSSFVFPYPRTGSPWCLGAGKKSYVTEMRGITGKDSRNSNRFVPGVMLKNPPSFESKPLIYDAVPPSDPPTMPIVSPLRGADLYSPIAQYDDPNFFLPGYHMPNNTTAEQSIPLVYRSDPSHVQLISSPSLSNGQTACVRQSTTPFAMLSPTLGTRDPEDVFKTSAVSSNLNSPEQSSGHTVTTVGPGSGNTGSSDGSVHLGGASWTARCPPAPVLTDKHCAPVDDVAPYDFCMANTLYQYVSIDGGPDANTESKVTEFVDRNGATIRLPAADVSLRVPMDSIPANCEQTVFLSIHNEDNDRPVLKDQQTLLSPAVQFGPGTLALSNPVVLTVPHCADLTAGAWMIHLLGSRIGKRNASSTAGTNLPSKSSHCEESEWEVLASVQFESGNQDAIHITPGVMCLLEPGLVHILTKLPGCYCLTGESIRSPAVDQPLIPKRNPDGCHRVARKSLTLAAFASRLTPMTSDYGIRIYVLSSTPDALAHVKRLEKQLEGHAIATVRTLGFTDDGSPMCFVIDSISAGWRSRLPNRTQEIPFRHIWNGTQTSTLHCAFSLERVGLGHQTVQCQISVFQESNPNAAQTLHISSANPEQSPKSHARQESTASQNSMLPSEQKYQLGELVNRDVGWQTVALESGYKHLDQELCSALYPTNVLIELWQSTRTSPSRFPRLDQMLRLSNDSGARPIGK